MTELQNKIIKTVISYHSFVPNYQGRYREFESEWLNRLFKEEAPDDIFNALKTMPGVKRHTMGGRRMVSIPVEYFYAQSR